MDDNVKQFTKQKVVSCPELEEMLHRIERVIYDYDALSIAEVIGVVDIVKHRLLTKQED